MDNGLPSESQHLRRQLEALLHEARLNERKMRRFDQLERQLVGAGSLAELIRLLLEDYRQAFGIEYVTLSLVDREQEVDRLLAASEQAFPPPALRLHSTEDAIVTRLGDLAEPWLGGFDPARHGPLFGDVPAGAIASVALLPLRRQDKLVGSLHLGSADAGRYESAAGTAFLERLASILAVCLDSALAQERLKLAGLTDGLTGVHNRRYFDHRFQVEVAQARRHKQPLACLLLDIDKFKRINDSYGHPAGDAVLRSVAAAIQKQLRTGDTIARYGGEEFAVLLPQTPGHYAREIGERIRTAIERQGCHLASGGALLVTLSVGVALLGEQDSANGADPAIALLGRADQALYAAKEGGRNRVVCDGHYPLPKAARGAWKLPLPRFGHWLPRQAGQALLERLRSLGHA